MGRVKTITTLFFAAGLTIALVALMVAADMIAQQAIEVLTNPTAPGKVLSAALTVESIPAVTIEAPVLIYHHIKDFTGSDEQADALYIVRPQNFEQQLAYLKDNGFTPLLLRDLPEYFSGQKVLPEKPVFLTFDDGLRSQFEVAAPILERVGFPATFFIFTNPISRSENYLTWDQLRTLVAAGNDVGTHGHYHLFWDRIDAAALSDEIFGSKTAIEEQLGIAVTTAAYPFGEYTPAVTAAVTNAGYLIARGISHGRVHQVDKLLALDGYFVTNSFGYFKNIVGGR